MRLQSWHKQLNMVGEQGTSRPSDFCLHLPLGHAQAHGLWRRQSRPYFSYCLQEVHPQTTNQSDRAGQTGLVEGLPSSVGHHGTWGVLVGSVLWTGKWDTVVQKAFLCTKPWFLSLLDGTDRDWADPEALRCCSEVAKLAQDRTTSKLRTRSRNQATLS